MKTIERSKPSAALAIFWGGLIVAVFDIAYAFAFYGARGVGPTRLLQGIASGALGPSAFAGGLATAALGLFFHFLISYGAATVYYIASRKLAFMIRQTVLSGLMYGVAVYLFMNFVVIPLSQIKPRPINPTLFVINLIEHMIVVGLPIALAVRKFSATPVDEAGLGPFQQGTSRAARAKFPYRLVWRIDPINRPLYPRAAHTSRPAHKRSG